jgi:dTDP-4-amino-4,6-dideoxygalactose transaminase
MLHHGKLALLLPLSALPEDPLTLPAVAGGRPAFPEPLPIARPSIPPIERVMERLRPSYETGQITNARLVGELEEAVAERLGVAHVVAVGNCTLGLMLVLHASAPKESVLLPSFTFSASAHAVAWNGLRPAFAECDPATFQLDVADAADRIEGVGAILATHVFGAPCPAEAVAALGRERGIPVIFDAAHGLGSLRGGTPLGGFGTAEVFSLSPTKPVVAGEGGLVTTNDEALAAAVRLGRNYGNPSDYNSRFAGLNARMSELHAALAIESLADIDDNLARRRAVAARYQAGLADIEGITPQRVDDGDTSTFKDFTISIDESDFGLSRDEVRKALSAENIETRAYFSPPVHRQAAYAHLDPTELPTTDGVASKVVSLPIFPALPLDTVDTVVATLRSLAASADAVRAALRDAD